MTKARKSTQQPYPVGILVIKGECRMTQLTSNDPHEAYLKRKQNAEDIWKTMSKDQKDAVLEILQSWVPIRCSISDLCPITYDDILKVDAAWYRLRSNLVSDEVEVETRGY
jgi:hypothetical protein